MKVGVPRNEDANSGNPVGSSELAKNWRDGKRQMASVAYRLRNHDRITPVTKQLVKRVRYLHVRRKQDYQRRRDSRWEPLPSQEEVIGTCGTYRSPQLLLLSSIGA